MRWNSFTGMWKKQQKPGLGYGIKINGAQKIAYEYDALGRVIRTHNHFSDMNTSTQEYTYVSGKEAGVTTNLVAICPRRKSCRILHL